LLARSAEDASIVLTDLAGHDPEDPASVRRPVRNYSERIAQGIRGFRVGVCPRFLDAVGVNIEVQAALEQSLKVLRSLGVSIREVEIPHLTYAPAADFTILRVEGFNLHLTNLRDKRDKYGTSAFHQIAAGGYLRAADYYRAQQARTLISGALAHTFKSIDILITPTTPQTAIPGEFVGPPQDSKVGRSGVAFLAPFNLTGSPAMSIPCGFTRAKMPIGLQLIGRAFDEETMLRAAYAYQTVTQWHTQRPVL
jgi:aspartyl-tRNA(Asn)/glutamyl-tRNA(Gln) amidotransferase subunit A